MAMAWLQTLEANCIGAFRALPSVNRAGEPEVFETIAEVNDPAIARVLVTALKAHGFHPLENGNDGLPGLPGVFGPRGLPIEVPESEANDARILAQALIKDMAGTAKP
jgi:hypothetical protein